MEYHIGLKVLSVLVALGAPIVAVDESTVQGPGLVNGTVSNNTAGPGLLEILKEFFKDPKGVNLAQVMEGVRTGGIFDGAGLIEYVRILVVKDLGSPGLYRADAKCETSAPITAREVCYREILLDEDEIASTAQDLQILIEVILANDPDLTEAESEAQFNDLIADQVAVVFAHELCHSVISSPEPGGTVFSDIFWEAPINQCARIVYNDIFGTTPIAFKLRECNSVTPLSAKQACFRALRNVPLPSKIGNPVNANPNNFNGIRGGFITMPTLPAGSTKERVWILP